MSSRRVVVTGMGVVTPVGNDVSSTWDAILRGESGVGSIQHFDPSRLSTTIAAELKGFDASQYLDKKMTRKLASFAHYGIAAATQAMQDSALKITDENASRVGVAIGSGVGGLDIIQAASRTLIESTPRRLSPYFIPAAIINTLSGVFSIENNLRGPNISIVTACTTGTHNIGHALRMIKYGDADVMFAGGAEMATSELGVAGFAAARALSKRNDDPTKASRPWDKDRDGFVLGEGAGVLVLEELQHALARGAHIYAELKGFGMSADAFHITLPDPTAEGFVGCMQTAITNSGLVPADIDYINAHGTSTPAGDVVEALAVKKLFADHAYELSVSSTKSMIGHLLGAAGAVEAVFTVLALRDQIAPPTINLDNPDEGCDLDFVPHKAKKRSIKHALSNSFGFGGTNGSLVFSNYVE